METRVIQDDSRPETAKDQLDSAVEPRQHDSRTGRTRRWSARQRKITGVLLLAALVLAGAFLASRPGATAAGAATGASDFAAIDNFVQAEMDAQRIPGLALAIVERDRAVHMRRPPRGVGLAEAAHGCRCLPSRRDYPTSPICCS
jgi:hypothetical protein